ncbi:MAG TPA: hypothetical protein VGL27_10055 [Negativicutes bacterium]
MKWHYVTKRGLRIHYFVVFVAAFWSVVNVIVISSYLFNFSISFIK